VGGAGEEPLWRGSPSGLAVVVQRLLGSGEELLLETVDAVPEERGMRLVYVFYSLSAGRPLVLEAVVEDRAVSISCLLPAARVYEEEIARLYGVRFEPCSWPSSRGERGGRS